MCLRIWLLLFLGCLLVADSTAQPEEEEEEPPIYSMQDLHAIQSSFFKRERGDLDNTLFMDYRLGQTPKLRLRYAMITTLVFSEPIREVILGDSVGFSTKMLGHERHQNSNVLLIKPLQIGIDSNLNVVGKSGKIYTFYIFSTTFTSPKHPVLNVYVSNKHFFQSSPDQPLAKFEEKEILKSNVLESKKDTPDSTRYLKIGDASNAMWIDKTQIKRNYKVLGSRKRAWFCLWLCRIDTAKLIKPLDIFNDAHFTYFKFDRKASQVKFPVAYKVVDGYDNPINTRIVGDYLIAEDIANKWTLREGKLHACIRHTRP